MIKKNKIKNIKKKDKEKREGNLGVGAKLH